MYFAQVLDQQGNVIKPGVVIKVALGTRQGTEGTVEHTYRQTVFMKSRIAVEDCGMLAVASNHVRVLGAMNASGPTVGRGAGRGGRGGRGRGRGAGRGQVELPTVNGIQFTTPNVKIILGTYKGFQVTDSAQRACAIPTCALHLV